VNSSERRFSRLIARFEKGRTERLEAWLALQFDHVLLTSRADRAAMSDLSPSATSAISILGNGVDVEHFEPDDQMVRDQATIVLSGKMSYHANVSMVLRFVREIMPLVWASRPDVKVVIAGKDPGHEIRSLARNPAIIVTGTVNDMRPYLQRATVAAVPLLYGAGVQNKVLEAMACGTPVVATPQAVSALNTEAGRDLIVADSTDDFARAVVSVLGDEEKQRALSVAGRAYVERHHNWNNITADLEEIYYAVIAQELQPN
jgi:glycosyltransferase involved in cell wall biosynthesis